MNKPHILAGLGLYLLSPAVALADGTTLSFVAAATTPGATGVASELYRRENNGVPVRVTPGGVAAARFSFVETDCRPTVQFMVEPVVTLLFTYALDDWRSCQPDGSYEFWFTPSIMTAQSRSLDVLLRAAAPTLGALTPAQMEIFSAALERADYGTLSFLSTELMTAYGKDGQADLAREWASVAVATGWEAVAMQDVAYAAAVDEPFRFENGAFLYSPDALEVLRQYQADTGLAASGKLDWPTMRSLSDLAKSDIYSLSVQRTELLAPISGF